jgi:hypothetical protein
MHTLATEQAASTDLSAHFYLSASIEIQSTTVGPQKESIVLEYRPNMEQ